ncbi:MAG: helix-turn-helix transcriptional regulator [Eubacteriales bacterium]|nr:helix-turn-helix transcriptional regulator [Eubacteriales bacterium]
MSKASENAFDFENLGQKVKELRIKNGLTQNQVASELHVTPGYISNVENNRTAMSLRVLSYYAKLTGITLDSLVGKIEPEYLPTALDHELQNLIAQLTDEEKQRLLRTIEVWKSDL